MIGFRTLHRKNKSAELAMSKRWIRNRNLGLYETSHARGYEIDTTSLRASLLMADSTIKERVQLD